MVSTFCLRLRSDRIWTAATRSLGAGFVGWGWFAGFVALEADSWLGWAWIKGRHNPATSVKPMRAICIIDLLD
jgi:hypothetical protein